MGTQKTKTTNTQQSRKKSKTKKKKKKKKKPKKKIPQERGKTVSIASKKVEEWPSDARGKKTGGGTMTRDSEKHRVTPLQRRGEGKISLLRNAIGNKREVGVLEKN